MLTLATRKRASSGPRSPASAYKRKATAKWREILSLIPGYDCWDTAAPGDCFDPDEARFAVEFFHECLHHVEGTFADPYPGKPFILERWQQAKIGALWGWKRRDGSRRYRECLMYEPRKNGKTPVSAGIGDMSLFTDREQGAKNVMAAASKDQAGQLFSHAAGFVERDDDMASRSKVYGGETGLFGSRTIYHPETNSSLQVVSSDAKTKHGYNGHLALIDELHAQADSDLLHVIETSSTSQNRRQPLTLYTTTADYDRPSACNVKYDYACKVRDRVIEDHAFLPVIYEAPKDADWQDEEVWKIANPNLGISVSLEELRRLALKARIDVTFTNEFRRLHLNQRTERESRFLDMVAYNQCPSVLPDLKGQRCIIGLDLATTVDITAWVAWFPEHKAFIGRYYLPEHTADKLMRDYSVPIPEFVESGQLVLTPGNEVDYGRVRQDILNFGQEHRIVCLVFDPFNATDITQQIEEEGITRIKFSQTTANFNTPTKRLEAYVMGRELNHGGDPVMRWMAGSAMVFTNTNGDIRPVKPKREKSGQRNDGIVALIMAIGQSLLEPVEPDGPAVIVLD